MKIALIKAGIFGVICTVVAAWLLGPQNRTAPDLPETWWRPGDEAKVDDKIRPFKVTFTKEMIEDLKYRLNRTRISAPPLQDTAWHYGMSSTFTQKIVDYWLNKYDFEKREGYINQYPHFKTNIQGLNIHYVHAKPVNSEGKRVLPLLILHGWPGSVMEFYKIIPLLTTPQPEYDFVFEVIAPSLPGFGFSDGATIPGLAPAQIAVVLKNLMLRLGHERFYTQGGDWGAIISADMASIFPQHVLGMHSNLCGVSRPWTLFKTFLYSFFPSLLLPVEDQPRMYPLSKRLQFLWQGSGYFHIQATKPDTIGTALNDSPAGLAAYILEKFSSGTNPAFEDRDDGGLLEKYTADELIDNLMMYWVPNCATTSGRLYAETLSFGYLGLQTPSIPVKVPCACAQFKYEIYYQPESFLKDRFENLIRATKFSQGGHFAALENPELLADDVWDAIGEMEAMRNPKKE